jgi:hypothetical protein
MRIIGVACLGLVLAGCGGTPDHRLVAPDGSPAGNIEDLFRPGVRDAAYKERHRATQATDDARCRELGFQTATDGYGNCRLKLAQIRATNRAAAATQAAQTQAVQPQQSGLSFMCKDAMTRGDSGAMQTFC